MKDLSELALEWMESLGGFEEADSGGEIVMRGFSVERMDGSCFAIPWTIDSAGWQELAAVCNEVAGRLEILNLTPLEPTKKVTK